jgi:hypothetical protein
MVSEKDVFLARYQPATLLKITGDDALAFLQGQFTQELRFPVGRLCAYGLWLNQKGRVLADSFALREGVSWWLFSLSSSSSILRERLEAYVVADDVTIEDCTQSWSGWTVFGPGATDWLARQGVKLPSSGEWAELEGGLIFRGRRDTAESWEWLRPQSLGLPSILEAGSALEVDQSAVERRRILAGIPLVPGDIGPNDLPNEAGLENDAISYSKGCYLGQEVMARLKSMGQIRRRLLTVRGSGSLPSCPAHLFAAAKKVGEIRSVVSDEEGAGFVGLAMISLLGLDAIERLSLEANGEATVQVFRKST